MNPNQIIIDLMEAMYMQVMRERELFHVNSQSAKTIWDEKYNNALKYLEENNVKVPQELYEMWK